MRKKNSWMQRLFYWICWLFSSQCFVSRNYQKLVTEEKGSQPREKDRWINLMKSSNEIQFSHLFLNCEKKHPRKTINFLHERTNFSADIIAKCIGIQLLKWHDCIWRFFIEIRAQSTKPWQVRVFYCRDLPQNKTQNWTPIDLHAHVIVSPIPLVRADSTLCHFSVVKVHACLYPICSVICLIYCFPLMCSWTRN